VSDVDMFVLLLETGDFIIAATKKLLF